jgi:Domain of unknown function (DUF4304)
MGPHRLCFYNDRTHAVQLLRGARDRSQRPLLQVRDLQTPLLVDVTDGTCPVARIMTASDTFDTFVRTSVAPPLKAAGFKKTALNWHRRRGRAVHVINMQHSTGNTHESKLFYMNVGVALDELCFHMGVEMSEKPKEYACDEIGVRGRINDFVPGLPTSWEVRTAPFEASAVVGGLQTVVAQMDAIEDVASFARTSWIDQSNDTKIKVLYLLNRDEASLEKLTWLSAQLHDRMNSDVDSLIVSLRVPRLRRLRQR